MATSQANVIGGLAELTFRGLPAVPCGDASYDFGHDQAERRYPYVDGAGYDNTGRTPIKFTATLYFVNTLQANLYPSVWNQWRDGLLDGSSAQLTHPDLGIVTARVLSGSVKLTATNRAGIVVTVTWVESNETVDQPAHYTGPSIDLRQAGSAADSAVLALGVSPPVFFAGNQTSIFGAIDTLLLSIASGLQAVSAIFAIIGTLEDFEDAITALNSTQAWPLVYNLEVIEAGLYDLAANVASTNRPTAQIVNDRETTLDQIATQVNNDVADLASLNPQLLGKPSIAAGVSVTYYTGT
jgi:prophage DNA circulation protein